MVRKGNTDTEDYVKLRGCFGVTLMYLKWCDVVVGKLPMKTPCSLLRHLSG